MFPGTHDFTWDAGHIIFLGAFYMVVLVIAGTVGTAVYRAIRDFRQHKQGAIQWHAEFEDLPLSARRCRHELNGEVKAEATEKKSVPPSSAA